MIDQKVGGWIQKQDAVELAYAMFSGNDCPAIIFPKDELDGRIYIAIPNL